MNQLRAFALASVVLQSGVILSEADADFAIKANVTKIAFGSCHKLKFATGDVWKSITDQDPEVFLWTGDAIYPPRRGVAPVAMLESEYDRMNTNDTVAYNTFNPPHGIYGVYDDHDWGGNDMGSKINDKGRRKEVFWNFLGYPALHPARTRPGMYHSIDIGHDLIKIIFLDTRWFRDDHCVPSVAASVPLGAGISCITRWLTAGLRLDKWIPGCQKKGTILGEDQWSWLENEISRSKARVHIVISSVQVLTSSPVIESWGHFPHERARLLSLLSGVSGSVLLSGDVHYAEILEMHHTPKSTLVEVTSSGLTHTCKLPFYGRLLCEPLLETFHEHRSAMENFYTGRNFGTIVVDWEARKLEVKVHDARNGSIVLSTGDLPFHRDQLLAAELSSLQQVMDGHLIGRAKTLATVSMMLALAFFLMLRIWKSAHAKPKQQ